MNIIKRLFYVAIIVVLFPFVVNAASVQISCDATDGKILPGGSTNCTLSVQSDSEVNRFTGSLASSDHLSISNVVLDGSWTGTASASFDVSTSEAKTGSFNIASFTITADNYNLGYDGNVSISSVGLYLNDAQSTADSNQANIRIMSTSTGITKVTIESEKYTFETNYNSVDSVLNYNIGSDSKVTITLTPVASGATISGDTGIKDVSFGKNEYVITVKSESGAETAYTIVVNRGNEDIVSEAQENINGNSNNVPETPVTTIDEPTETTTTPTKTITNPKTGVAFPILLIIILGSGFLLFRYLKTKNKSKLIK